ncbi:MAG: hypothetical protein V4598_15660 [Bdellovibrionota bacterium]
MKLFTLVFFTIFSLSAFADWGLPRFNRNDNSTGGLRTVWSCPGNRGDMPEQREVEIYYDENRQLAFRPDLFGRSMNPLNALRSLFGRKKDSSNVDECLRSFLATIPQAVANYQEARCSGSSDLVCTRPGADVSLDAGRKIRSSAFYSKYRENLASVEDLLPAPEITERPVTPRRPEVASTPVNNRPVPDRLLPRPEDNPDRSRTRLLDYMVDNYAKFTDLKEFATHCPQMGATTGVNAVYCRDRQTRNNTFLTNLSQMFTAVRGEPITQERLLQSIECLPPRADDFSDLTDILHKMDEQDECGALANVGDHKLFRKAHGGTQAWYTSGNYLLKRTAADTYEATLNLDFTNNGGTMSSQEMMNKVRGCLADASQFMRGPNGARLNIKALSPAEVEAQLPRSERPLPGVINIVPDQVRLANGMMTANEINAANFRSNIDCPTATHEILHHLGLCDEYRETRTNIVPGLTRSRAEEWSCRVVPSAPSIMKNQNEVYNGAMPQQFSCNCVNDGCRNAMNGTDARSVAHKKLLMTSSPHDILGSLAPHCSNPVYLATVDEVSEPDKAYIDVVSRPGVLTFQNRSLLSDSGRFRISRKNVTCTCPADDVSCPAALARAGELIATNPDIKECPLHTQSTSEKTLAPQGAVTALNPIGFTFVSTPYMDSLVTPSQFDKILTGNCRQGVSELYKRCSEFSYVPQESSACAQKPAECSDDNQFLGRSSAQ